MAWCAPRLRASIPTAPEPAKRSIKIEPSTTGPRILNSVSRKRSLDGRSASPRRLWIFLLRYFPAITRMPLSEPLSSDDIDTERSIFVSQGNDGKIGPYRVLDLDDLLLGRSYVSAVRNHQVSRKLLPNGDTRPRTLPNGGAGQVGGIHAEMADAKQALHAAAQLRRDGFGKQRCRTHFGSLRGGGATKLAFLAGLAQC